MDITCKELKLQYTGGEPTDECDCSRCNYAGITNQNGKLVDVCVNCNKIPDCKNCAHWRLLSKEVQKIIKTLKAYYKTDSIDISFDDISHHREYTIKIFKRGNLIKLSTDKELSVALDTITKDWGK